MRRKLNVRLLLITLAILIACGGAFHALHVWQVDRNVASLLAYAREATKAKKYDQAFSLYDQYLKQVPNDFDVQEELAKELDELSVSPRDRIRVVALYEGLLLKSANRPDARERLIANLILLGRYDAAVRNLEILKPTAADPAEIEHRRGWCLDADGKAEPAAQAFRAAVALDPKRIGSWLLLAETLHHRLSKDVDAHKALDAMVAANPKSAAARLGRFRYERLLGRDAEAAADLAEAERLAPEDANVILAASQWAQSKGDFARARDWVDKGAKLYPANEAIIKELASLELRQGRRDRALQVIEDGLKALDQKVLSGELQIFRADLLIDAGRTKEAEALIAELRKEGLAPALPDFLEARLLIGAKAWQQAQALLEKSRAAIGADPYWNGRISALLGVCYGQQGDRDRQVAALLDAARSEPRWPALNFSLGQAYLDADNPEQALIYLAPLLGEAEAPRGTQTLIALARLRIALQRPARERNWKDIDEALAQAEKRDPGSLDVAVLRAKILEAQGRLDDARSVLAREIKKRMTKHDPDDLSAWLAYADLEARTGDDDRASSILTDALKRFGDLAAIRLSKARLLAQRGRTGDRTALKALADGAEALSVDERGRLHRDLAEIWLRLGDAAAARQLLVKAADELPRDVRSRSLLLDLDLQEGKLDDARHWLKEMQTLEGPGGALSTYASLYLRTEEAFGKPDSLKKLLAELKNSPLRRGDGRVELVEARIHERLGDDDLALKKLLEAAYAGQRSPAVLQKLVKLLTVRQEYDQLSWVIAEIEGRGPAPREVGRAAVEASIAKGNVEQARELLGTVVLEAIRDYRELLWLGQTYKALNEPARAEAALRRAVAVAPHATDAWVALTNELVAAGRRAKGQDLVADIERKAPVKNRPIIAARVLQALGQVAEADAAFQKALLARPNDFLIALAAADFYRQTEQLQRAEPLYMKILDPKLATPPEIAARARRGLALTLSADPSKAAAVLAGNRDRKELVDERLALYLEGLDPARQTEALHAFEATLSRGPLSLDESFWLADLLNRAGKTDAAAARLERLTLDPAATPAMLATYARMLIREGKLDAARAVVAQLRNREPDSPRTRDLQAQLTKK